MQCACNLSAVDGDINLRDCCIYLDDIGIFFKSFDEHVEKLQPFLHRLQEHGLKLKSSKCELPSQMVYLGHVVSKEVIHIDPSKTKVVKNWPTPNAPSMPINFFDLQATTAV